jgi:hypothetical protein
LADVLEVGADETELLLFASFFYFVYLFNPSFIEETASETVNRIRWINDKPSVLQDFGSFLDQSGLGVLTVY